MTRTVATMRFTARRGPARRRVRRLALPVSRGGKAKSAAAGAGLLFIALALLLETSCTPSRTRFVAKAFEAEGHGVGQAVAEALPDGGEVVVIPAADQPEVLQEMMAARLRGLSSVLKQPDWSVMVAQGLDAEDMDHSDPDYISAGRFASCRARYPQAAAIVSFDALPPGNTSGPPVFLGAVAYETAAEALLKQGAVRAYLRARPDAKPRARPPAGASLEDIFTARYEVVSHL